MFFVLSKPAIYLGLGKMGKVCDLARAGFCWQAPTKPRFFKRFLSAVVFCSR